MNSNRLVALMAVMAFVAVAAWSFLSPNRMAEAQGDHPVGIAATLRATRAAIPPGGDVTLRGGLMNLGQNVIEVELACSPPVDFEVRNAEGTVVWRWASPCNGEGHVVRLEGGAHREWDAVWHGNYSGGDRSVPAGWYTAWAIVHTAGRETGAGPVRIRVGEDGGGEEPTRHPPATEGPRPTEGPHPTEVPHPTEAAREPDQPPFFVGGGEGAQRRPDVAGHPEFEDCQNLVVWWDEADNAIKGRFVELGSHGEPFLISGDAHASGAPAVAFHTSRRTWLVVWPAPSDDATTHLAGRYVQCAGLEGPVFHLTEGDSNDNEPAVAASGQGFAVVWTRVQAAGSHVRGAYLAGTALSANVVLEDGGANQPAVACESAEPCLVVWTQAGEGGNNVIGRWWFPREELPGDVYLTIAGGPPNQREPSVAWRGGDLRNYLVSWTEGEGDAVVRVRAVGIDGNAAHKDAYFFRTEPATVSEGVPSSQSDVAALGDGFVVVWSEASRGPAEIRGRRVLVARETTRTGARVDVSRPVIDFPPADTYPAVAAAGSGVALVVWESLTTAPSDSGEIWGRHSHFPAPTNSGRVVLDGVVTRVGAQIQQAEGVVDVAVERVVSGTFPCQTARVYYAPDAWQVPAVGARVRVSGDPPTSGEACVLDIGAQGTGIVAAGGPAFAPYAVQR